MFAKAVFGALSAFSDWNGGQTLGDHLRQSADALNMGQSPYTLSKACKPFVAGTAKISEWIRMSYSGDHAKAWVEFGGAELVRVMNAVAPTTLSKCKKGLIYTFSRILPLIELTEDEEYDLITSFETICDPFAGELRLIWFNQRSIIVFWSLCPGNMSEMRMGPEDYSSLLDNVEKLLKFRTDRIPKIFERIQPATLIPLLEDRTNSKDLLKRLAGLVNDVDLVFRYLPGSEDICSVGYPILGSLVAEKAKYLNLISLCPTIFKDGYCGGDSNRPDKETWITVDEKGTDLDPLLLLSIFSLSGKSDDGCLEAMKAAVAHLVSSVSLKHKLWMPEIEEALQAYKDLCPFMDIPLRKGLVPGGKAWIVTDYCSRHAQGKMLVCNTIEGVNATHDLSNIWSFRAHLGRSLESVFFDLDLANLARVGGEQCRAPILKFFNASIIHIDMTRLNESEFRLLCESLNSEDKAKYKQVASMCYPCEALATETDHNLWVFYWKRCGSPVNELCVYANRDVAWSPTSSRIDNLINHLETDSAILNIVKHASTCGSNVILKSLEYISGLIHAGLIQFDLFQVSKMERLRVDLSSLCESSDEVIAELVKADSLHSILGMVCPNRVKLSISGLYFLRHSAGFSNRYFKDTSSFCALFDSDYIDNDTALTKYCKESCDNVMLTNVGIYLWMSEWLRCGSPADTICHMVDAMFPNWESSEMKILDSRLRGDVSTVWTTINTFVENWQQPTGDIPCYDKFIGMAGSVIGESLRALWKQSFVNRPETIQNIETFCRSEESFIVSSLSDPLFEKSLIFLLPVCRNIPRSTSQLRKVLIASQYENLSYLCESASDERLCSSECRDLFLLDSGIEHWVPRWLRCGSPPEIVCPYVKKGINNKPDDSASFGSFTDSLDGWEKVTEKSVPCGDDLVRAIAHRLTRAAESSELEKPPVTFCTRQESLLSRWIGTPTDRPLLLSLYKVCPNIRFTHPWLYDLYVKRGKGSIDLFCADFEEIVNDKKILDSFCNRKCWNLMDTAKPASWLSLWKQCDYPMDTVCEYFHRVPPNRLSLEDMLSSAQVNSNNFESFLMNTFSFPHLMAAVDNCTSCVGQVSEYVATILSALVVHLSQDMGGPVNVFRNSNASVLELIASFCSQNASRIEQWISTRSHLSELMYVCPRIPVPMDKLRGIIMPRIPDVRSRVTRGPLEIHMETAFSDSLPTLLSDRCIPVKIKYTGSPAQDQDGVTRDWMSRIAATASSKSECDPAGGDLFEMKNDDFLVFSDRIDINMDYYTALGRLLAISIIKQEPMGIPLPTYFFAKFLYGNIRFEDLFPEEIDLMTSLDNLVRHLKNKPDDVLPFDLPDGTMVEMTFASATEDIHKIADAQIPPKFNDALDRIRSGFGFLIPIENIRPVISPTMLKYLIEGDGELDVDELQRLAKRTDPRFPGGTPVSDKVFQWLFDWLRGQTKDIKRKFMFFVTGSSSLLPKPLLVQGPENDKQKKKPHARTCFFRITLPNYTSEQELGKNVFEAIHNTEFVFA